MLKLKFVSQLVGLATIVLGSYLGLRHLAVNPPSHPIGAAQLPIPSADAALFETSSNPLLTADKATVSIWFPGLCFAELYLRNPSFKGALVEKCLAQVIENVERDTGVSLRREEVVSDEVVRHFKQLYGGSGPWLK